MLHFVWGHLSRKQTVGYFNVEQLSTALMSTNFQTFYLIAMLLFSSTIYQQYTKPDFFASLSSWVLSPGSVQSATSILTIGTLKDRMSCFYYTRLSSNSKPPTPLKLPLNPIPGEVTKLFYNVRLSLNPIRGEVTGLFYYIWLPLNPIRGEVTELFY